MQSPAVFALTSVFSLALCGCSSTALPVVSDAAPTDASAPTIDAGTCMAGFEWIDTPPARGRIVSQPYAVPSRIVGLASGGFAVVSASGDHASLTLVPSRGDWSVDASSPGAWAGSMNGIARLALRDTSAGLLVGAVGYDDVRWARWRGGAWEETGFAPLADPGRGPDDLVFADDSSIAVLTHARMLSADPSRWNDTFLRTIDLASRTAHDRTWLGASDLNVPARVAFDGATPLLLGHSLEGTGASAVERTTLRWGDAAPTVLDGCTTNLGARVATDHRVWISCGSLRVYALANGESARPIWADDQPEHDPWFSSVLPLPDRGALVAAFAGGQYIRLVRLDASGGVLARATLDIGIGRLNHPVELAASPDGTFAVLWSRWGTGDVLRFRLC